MQIRIEVPVLLYASIDLPDDATDENGLTDFAKIRVYEMLDRALRKGEDGAQFAESLLTDPTVTLSWFRNARIRLTEDRFPVHSRDGLGLALDDGEVGK